MSQLDNSLNDHSKNPPVAIRKAPRSSQAYSVTWIMTNKCQNSCSYCPADVHSGKRDEYTVDEAMSFLNRLIDRYERIHFAISGGEPTVASHFLPVVERIREAKCTVGITSNGRRPVEFWNRVAPMLEYACVSYHPEFEKDDEDFLERMAVIGEKTRLTLRIMMLPESWDQCMGFIEKFKKSSILGRLELVRILDDFGGGTQIRPIHYTAEQEAFLKVTEPFVRVNQNLGHSAVTGGDAIFADGRVEKWFDANAWVTRGQTNFKGWICNIGVESLFIRFDGNVYRGNCAVGGIIGTIRDKDFKWPSVPIYCTDHLCHCSTDIVIPKHKVIEAEPKVKELVNGPAPEIEAQL